MISERDIDRAIEECQNSKENYNTCEKLATFLTLKHLLYGEEHETPQYSNDSGSEFMVAISGKDIGKVYAVFDELMETLSVVYPRLYDGVMRRLAE